MVFTVEDVHGETEMKDLHLHLFNETPSTEHLKKKKLHAELGQK